MEDASLVPILTLGIVINLTFAAIANIEKLFPHTHKILNDVASILKERGEFPLPDDIIEDERSADNFLKMRDRINAFLIGYKPAIAHSFSHSLIVMYGTAILIYIVVTSSNQFHHQFVSHLNILFFLLMTVEAIRITHIMTRRSREELGHLVNNIERLKPQQRFLPPYYKIYWIRISIIIIVTSIVFCLIFCKESYSDILKTTNQILIISNLFLIIFTKVLINSYCRFTTFRVCRRAKIR